MSIAMETGFLQGAVDQRRDTELVLVSISTTWLLSTRLTNSLPSRDGCPYSGLPPRATLAMTVPRRGSTTVELLASPLREKTCFDEGSYTIASASSAARILRSVL